ncbi:phosphoribosylanthranilate isomerase [Phenylobacterium sp.]|nr:phosphoribosylanthranilate isomerase [Phenylobacterium sp.]MCA6286477.1 phosphoribosylanthranilate isomerase [Phenylobacterium sp.]MCA6288798.1 phosphoribosylanthranilate isomerase [Phenylobacterium sp.]MCA6309234.1 phosphoribosylanthranilate isomerase [Phenylobacterium sp.]MCA6322888.1 phosphoribosylanthranilate isomerase [Phenylobacterium sp.]MCA6336795.1 phosphoribosylanthranilate isomerase [Phenylobacterium sp.]
MRLPAKICGLSTPEAVEAAVRGGAGFLGFNFFPPSPRSVTPEAAARLAAPARAAGVRICAITVDADDELVDRIAAILDPDFIQLHGAEPPARGAEVTARTGAGLIRALPVGGPEDLAAAAPWTELADHLLLDARPPKGAAMTGGLGVAFDWTLTQGFRPPRPWFLAGGLDPWNIAEALEVSGAPMADVSSGVERGPGLKDPSLISAFLDAVRRARPQA